MADKRLPEFEHTISNGSRVLQELINVAKANKLNVPHEGLKDLKGIVLIHSHKGAAVVGWEQGNGAAFKVLGEDADGTPVLSAPIPMLLQKFTVGLQLGYNSVFTMLAIYDDIVFDDMVRVDTAGMVMGKDIVLTGLQDIDTSTAANTYHSTSVHSMPADAAEAKVLKHTKPVRAITVSESFMVIDVSLYGGSLAVDVEKLVGVYGGGATVPQVLHGTVPMPAALVGPVAGLGKELAALRQAVDRSALFMQQANAEAAKLYSLS
ncbi:hypothetical protein HYH02_010844 [Chlamydomonas schloesseri]|uniref:Ysc84 actin-binding domain-containing protein n=1 Tax=Chlamydomonas schloesseri TaxID=2026947 RepID=A0A835W5Z1_9CHLO|nr:hypothetical protein HYH02_010844 [Chlamydomonas schloesseri]|eukprot:KAG2438389.1 hypothetical protein HYH02_010844 [Chlamydomonas schloesseri]